MMHNDVTLKVRRNQRESWQGDRDVSVQKINR